MKPFRLLHILQHITQKSDCPHCHAQILPEKVHIDTSSDNSAFLSIVCPQCKHHLQAHVFASFTDPEMEKKIEGVQSEITPQEMKQAYAKIAQHDGDISSLFSQ